MQNFNLNTQKRDFDILFILFFLTLYCDFFLYILLLERLKDKYQDNSKHQKKRKKDDEEKKEQKEFSFFDVQKHIKRCDKK